MSTMTMPGTEARQSGTATGTRVRDALRPFVKTDADHGLLLVRVALGTVILAHGAQKLLGWFDGFGVQGTIEFFASIGLPGWLALLVIASDFFGSLALIAGVLGRFAGLGAFAVMLGAVFTLHAPNGFFMNWGGLPRGEGFEFHLLAMAMALAVVLKGSGSWSVDRVIARRQEP